MDLQLKLIVKSCFCFFIIIAVFGHTAVQADCSTASIQKCIDTFRKFFDDANFPTLADWRRNYCDALRDYWTCLKNSVCSSNYNWPTLDWSNCYQWFPGEYSEGPSSGRSSVSSWSSVSSGPTAVHADCPQAEAQKCGDTFGKYISENIHDLLDLADYRNYCDALRDLWTCVKNVGCDVGSLTGIYNWDTCYQRFPGEYAEFPSSGKSTVSSLSGVSSPWTGIFPLVSPSSGLSSSSPGVSSVSSSSGVSSSSSGVSSSSSGVSSSSFGVLSNSSSSGVSSSSSGVSSSSSGVSSVINCSSIFVITLISFAALLL